MYIDYEKYIEFIRRSKLRFRKFMLSLMRKKSECDCVSLVRLDSCEFLMYGLVQVFNMHISS